MPVKFVGLWLDAGCKATGANAGPLPLVTMFPVLKTGTTIVRGPDITFADALAPGAPEVSTEALLESSPERADGCPEGVGLGPPDDLS